MKNTISNADANAAAPEIANLILCIETLDGHHDLSVGRIRAALVAAYEVGHSAASAQHRAQQIINDCDCTAASSPVQGG